MKKIKVRINNEGEVQVSTEGFKGPECLAATRGLENALGVVENNRPTPEMYEQEATQDQEQGNASY